MAETEHLVLRISAGSDEDDESHAMLARRLRRELSELDAVSKVDVVRRADLPAGAKGDALALSSLALAVAPSAVTALMNMLQSWVSRHDRATITVETANQKLTITGTPSRAQEELLTQFLQARQVSKT